MPVDELLQMLTYRRPHGSSGEKTFINKYLEPLGIESLGLLPDQTGPAAYAKVVPMPDGTVSRTLFSCHTDTVHRDDARQGVVYDSEKQTVYKTDGTPLGADDGAGVWLLMQMVRAGVPGTYMFHRGEERGGIGSSHIAAHHAPYLNNYDRAIAFDRKATFSIITHQAYDRCCSETFATNLADRLNDLMPNDAFAPDDSGIFTDTANYTKDIAECTNVSVGYYSEHTEKELLDVAFLVRLAEVCIKLNWEGLPTERKPGEVEASRWPFDDDVWNTGRGLTKLDRDARFAPVTVEEYLSMDESGLEELCWENPESAVELLMDLKGYFKEEVNSN